MPEPGQNMEDTRNLLIDNCYQDEESDNVPKSPNSDMRNTKSNSQLYDRATTLKDEHMRDRTQTMHFGNQKSIIRTPELLNEDSFRYATEGRPIDTQEAQNDSKTSSNKDMEKLSHSINDDF